MEIYENITYSDAQKRLSNRFTKGGLPDLADIKARRAFDEGDHWQNGNGFIGQLPTGENAGERTEMLRKAFSPEDVISEVLDTHVQNVLGEEPLLSFDGENAAEVSEVVKEWAKTRDLTGVMADGLRGARRESARVLRVFVPSGMIDGEGGIAAENLADALSKIWIRSEPIENGGVLIDEQTATELGLFLYKMTAEKQTVSLSEYAYLDEEGKTVWGTKSAHTQKIGEEEADRLDLGGRLPIYQMNAKPLISAAVCQAQRDVNLSGSMLTKNNNRAGDLERWALGVELPGEYFDSGKKDAAGNKIMEFAPKELKTGAGIMNFLQPTASRDKDGNITAFANPNLIFSNPVPIDTFVGTSEYWRRAIYAKAKQLHVLAANDGRINGVSRVSMRKEFQASLKESKSIVDPTGAWAIETALNIAAHFIGKPGRFLKTKVSFAAQIATIELTPEERREIVDEYKAQIIDLRTALELLQYKNIDEIINRVEARQKKDSANKPEDLTGV